MKKRVSFYVSRNNVLVWLAALALVASAIVRIAYFCGKGADATTVWLQIVLPVAGCLIYVLILLLDGQERFYRTSVPVFMLAIYYGIKVSLIPYSAMLGLTFVFWVAYLAIAAFYMVTVSGHMRNNWLLVLLLAGRLGCCLCRCAGHPVPVRRTVCGAGDAGASGRGVSSHLGRPLRRAQAPLARPDADRGQLHHAHAL